MKKIIFGPINNFEIGAQQISLNMIDISTINNKNYSNLWEIIKNTINYIPEKWFERKVYELPAIGISGTPGICLKRLLKISRFPSIKAKIPTITSPIM